MASVRLKLATVVAVPETLAVTLTLLLNVVALTLPLTTKLAAEAGRARPASARPATRTDTNARAATRWAVRTVTPGDLGAVVCAISIGLPLRVALRARLALPDSERPTLTAHYLLWCISSALREAHKLPEAALQPQEPPPSPEPPP